jgi:hypothetical protein
MHVHFCHELVFVTPFMHVCIRVDGLHERGLVQQAGDKGVGRGGCYRAKGIGSWNRHPRRLPDCPPSPPPRGTRSGRQKGADREHLFVLLHPLYTDAMPRCIYLYSNYICTHYTRKYMELGSDAFKYLKISLGGGGSKYVIYTCTRGGRST